MSCRSTQNIDISQYFSCFVVMNGEPLLKHYDLAKINRVKKKTLNQLNKWGLNPSIRYLKEKFLLETSLISKKNKMLIS